MSNRVMVNGKRSVVILDIDGFLADNKARLATLDREAPDWPAFHAASINDPVLPGGLALANALYEGGHLIALVTCRWDEYRQITNEWLVRYAIRCHLLLMRSSGLEHYDVKRHHAKELQERYHVSLAVDDDPKHGEEYAELGIPFLYVASGYYDGGFVPDEHLATGRAL